VRRIGIDTDELAVIEFSRRQGEAAMDSGKNKKSEEQKPVPLPSTGEGADSALDVLRKKRSELPPSDPTLPLVPPKKAAS
jgi:hypothetical protein